MTRTSIITAIILFLIFTVAGVVAAAQDGQGSIEGFVYEDSDGDGLCESGTESGVGGIEIQFENLDNDDVATEVTAGDGSYTLQAASEGSWEVVVNPGSGWAVTSSETIEVLVAEDDEIADVVFCIQRESSQAPAAQANGSISGFVYNDVDENGVCTSADSQGQPGIPVQLIHNASNSTFTVTSGSAGAYSYGAAELGSWQVTVNPGSGWRVTSQQTRQVQLTTTDPAVNSVDFCIVRVPDSGGGGQTVLPESGAPIAPGLLLTALLGLLSLLAGGLILVRTR
jgi:hypothetical protein